jgi:2-hydroxy-6-oxonona-2,4-dienedioate hydrolase
LDEQQYRQAEERFWREEGATPTERFVRLPRKGLQVRVLEVGEGPPALFVHGGPASGVGWVPLAARIFGLRCIVLDRPGTGLSDPFRWRRNTLREELETLVVEVLDALDIDKAHLVGSSSGSDFTLMAGLRHPSRVLRSVHFGCPGFAPGMNVPFVQRLMYQPGLWRLARRAMPVSEKGMRSVMLQMGHGASLEAGRISEACLAAYSALYRHTPTLIHEMQGGSTMVTLGGTGMLPSLVFTAEDLAAIESPTYFLWGDNDVFADVQIGRGMVEHMPNAELEVLPQGGHLPWLDDPERAAAVTMRHLLGDEAKAKTSAMGARRPLSG